MENVFISWYVRVTIIILHCTGGEKMEQFFYQSNVFIKTGEHSAKSLGHHAESQHSYANTCTCTRGL